MIAGYDIEIKDLDYNIQDNTVRIDLDILINILKKIQEIITDIDERLDGGGL